MLIDGGSSGVTADDDKKIQYAEWTAAINTVRAIGNSWADFVRLRTAAESD